MNSVFSRFEHQNTELAKLLRSLSGQTVLYVPNNGNAGDSLIAAATYQLFDSYKIKYELIEAPHHLVGVERRTIFLGGGGNLVPLYSTMAAFVRAATGRGNKVVILPHSIRGNTELLMALPSETVLFCRERLSFEHTRRHAPQAQVLLGHDLGLYADLSALDAAARERAFSKEFESLVFNNTGSTLDELRSKHLQCIRGGSESTIKHCSGRNFDASTYFRFGVMPGGAEKGAWMLVEFVRLAQKVTTNRLHIGIAAAISGVEAVLLDNNYGKLSGVYEHSMRSFFPHASFQGEAVKEDPFQNGSLR